MGRAHPLPQGGPEALWSKTGRALGLAIGVGLILQLAPGLQPLRWMPEDRTVFLPKLLRAAPVEGAEDESLTAEVDDTLLVAMGPKVGEPEPEVAPHRPAPPEEERLVYSSDSDLPPAPPLRTTAGGLPLLSIEDHQGAMARFYRSLDRVAAKRPGAVARVLHYGDSLIAGDYVTQTVRRLMQKKFGDAGAGFMLAGRPSPWYKRNNMRLLSSDGWKINRVTNPPIRDGLYDLGGVSFRTRARSEWVRAEPRHPDGPNSSISKMQVFYLAQPRGGRFALRVDHRTVEVNTRSAETGSRTVDIMIPPGPHTLRLKTLGGGEVRLFGMVFEGQGPGVVYDSLGVDGARAKLLKRFNPEHWHEQIRLRHPDLLVLHYGTNESQWKNLSPTEYYADLAQIVGHLRAALPGVSCLLVGPMDRAEKGPNGKLRTRAVVKRIVHGQREVAFAQGCAFWNTFAAMGGTNSMARWYRARPSLAAGDLTHPTRRGADRLGAMLFAALMDGYGRYRAGR